MQATIRTIAPFDATIGTTITFSWTGAQVFKNRCIIRDNETNETVYDYTIESFKLEHEILISEASLENGKKYNAYITVFDKDDNESDLQSVPTTFLCLATPLFHFTNCINGQVLSSSSYEFILEYSQENGEELDSWSISIYNNSKIVTATSGTQYDTEQMSYAFSGFNNATDYYIRAEGKTINGYILDTGYISVSVTFKFMEIFSLFETTNLPELGAIFGQANISAIKGTTTNDPIYINGKYLDLRNDTLVYNEDGFSITGDFSVVVKAFNIRPNVPLVILHGDDPDPCTLTVYYRVRFLSKDNLEGFFELQAESEGTKAAYMSNAVEEIALKKAENPTNDYDYVVKEPQKKFMILIMRSNGLYTIRAKVLDEEI